MSSSTDTTIHDARRDAGLPEPRPRIYAAFASYKGIPVEEAQERVCAAELTQAGYDVGIAIVPGVALLDFARNELFKQAVLAACEWTLFMDDDARIAARSMREMLDLDMPVLSAPVQMRTESRAPNVAWNGQPVTHPNGLQTLDCAVTGLGAVLVRRDAMERIWEHYQHLHYRSPYDGKRTLALFSSTLVPAVELNPEDTSGENILQGDDLIFSWRIRQAGLKIRAYMQATTQHADLPPYCLAHDERYFRKPAP